MAEQRNPVADELARCMRIVEGEAAACFMHARSLKKTRIRGHAAAAKMHTCAGNVLLAAAAYMKRGERRTGKADLGDRAPGRRLAAFRTLVEREVLAELARDGGGKHYEGRVTYRVVLPPVCEGPNAAESHLLELDCYILGPGRHYYWHAATEAEVFDQAEADFREWVREAQEGA